MNFKLVLICMGAMLLAQGGDALLILNRFGAFPFGPFGPFGGIIPPFGPLGLPIGPLGFGGLGFGGLGLGFGGIGRFGLGGFGRFGLGGFGRGRFGREANANMTECMISSETKKLSCAGLHEFSCDIAQNFTGLGSFSFVIKDLQLAKTKIEDVPVYHFLAEKEVDKKIVTEEHTFVNPADNKPVTLSLYWSDKLSELGFRFTEEKCFNKFDDMVKSTEPEMLDFGLFITQA
jgi:hypothetical protein